MKKNDTWDFVQTYSKHWMAVKQNYYQENKSMYYVKF